MLPPEAREPDATQILYRYRDGILMINNQEAFEYWWDEQNLLCNETSLFFTGLLLLGRPVRVRKRSRISESRVKSENDLLGAILVLLLRGLQIIIGNARPPCLFLGVALVFSRRSRSCLIPACIKVGWDEGVSVEFYSLSRSRRKGCARPVSEGQ